MTFIRQSDPILGGWVGFRQTYIQVKGNLIAEIGKLLIKILNNEKEKFTDNINIDFWFGENLTRSK